MNDAMPKGTARLLIVDGVEGVSVYLNAYRVSGPKPWGGGEVVIERDISLEEIDRALGRAGKVDRTNG